MKLNYIHQARFDTTKIVIIGFLAAITLGTLLLLMPFATAEGKATDGMTALFTATSSVCGVGMTVVPTYSHWSLFGKIVILFMIQLGGLGVICCAVGFFMIIGKKISLKERKLIQESYNLDSAKGMVRTVQNIIVGTFIIEGIGAIFYAVQFVPEYGFAKGLFYAIFHSVSAFCNSGIDILGNNSLIDYQTNVLVNLTTMILAVLGGLGFIVWMDFIKIFREIKSGKLAKRKFFERMTPHSKIVLVTTALLIVSGWVLVFLFEFNNPETMGNMTNGNKVLAALFESVTLRTAGFITMLQTGVNDATFIIMCIFMLIGGSPMGTAGGIKTTTVALMFLSFKSTVQGKPDVEGFRRKISDDSVKNALAIVSVFLSVLVVAIILLTITENAELKNILVEAVAAIGTTGISMKLTTSLSVVGKLIVIVLMFFGRIGPITIAMALTSKKKKSANIKLSEKRILVG